MHNFFKALQNKPVVSAPVKQEYRLYYEKDTGRALYYSMADDEGTYIVVDKETFVKAKTNIQVVNGKLHEVVYTVVYKLVPGVSGTNCCKTDVSLVDVNSDACWGNKINSKEIK